MDAATRERFVDSVLALLELTPIADRLAGSLGRGELKRLTVGAYVVAAICC